MDLWLVLDAKSRVEKRVSPTWQFGGSSLLNPLLAGCPTDPLQVAEPYPIAIEFYVHRNPETPKKPRDGIIKTVVMALLQYRNIVNYEAQQGAADLLYCPSPIAPWLTTNPPSRLRGLPGQVQGIARTDVDACHWPDQHRRG